MKHTNAEANAEAILALYDAGHSTRAIAEAFGHGKSTVNAVIVRHGGRIRQKIGCDHPDFFDSIDTPEKAYWLGFLTADGCIHGTPACPEGAYLTIDLCVGDAGHLVKLKKAVGAARNVRTAVKRSGAQLQSYATLAVGSYQLAHGLVMLGLTPRKSATVRPWDGPADLMPHFWRGMMDGDGSLAFKGNGVYTAFLCGSEACVRGFTEWAHGICGTKATPYFRTGCWYVSISGRYQVPTLVRALYGDAPVSLDRKQERADAILAADGPRKKPGPASRFGSEEEKREHTRKLKREGQRRYRAAKRQRDTEAE
jgi:hypothetical protein